MAINVFAPKKKYNQQGQLMSSQLVQGSGYSSNYASNASNYKPMVQPAVKASTYNTSNYLSNMVKKPIVSAPKPQPQQSVTRQPVKIQTPNILPWGTNTGAMPWGLKQQTTPTPRVQGPMSKAPQMSVAPKVQNMSVDPNAGKYRTTPPPQPQPEAQPQADPQSEWMKYISGTGERQKTLAEQQREATMEYLRQQGQLTNEQLLGQIPVAQEGFNQFKGNTEATIADLIKGGEMQKSQTEDYYGDAQRQAAQTLRETQGQQAKTFANLGTLDSRGEGSFSEANTNVMSDFNRTTQQNLKAKADKLTEIDMSVRQAERQARQAIVQEEQKLKQLERDIQYAVANNDLETASGLKQAYLQSQQLIYDIEDAMAETKYAFALEQQNLENEIAKVQSFTPEFMATGVPTNQAEYEFIIKNQKDAANYYGTGTTGGKQTEKQMAYTAAANIAQNALNKLNSGQVSTGIGNKVLGSLGEKLGTNSVEQQAYRSDIAAMRTAIQNALLGANMSPKEMEQIMAAIPQYNDNIDIAKSKLQSLMTNLPIMAGGGQEVAQQYDSDTINQILASLGN